MRHMHLWVISHSHTWTHKYHAALIDISVSPAAQYLSLVRKGKTHPSLKVSFPVLLWTRLRLGSSSLVRNCEWHLANLVSRPFHLQFLITCGMQKLQVIKSWRWERPGSKASCMTESHAFGANLTIFDKISLSWACWPWEVCNMSAMVRNVNQSGKMSQHGLTRICWQIHRP